MTALTKPLYTARATATGGRSGHGATDDGLLDVDLRVAIPGVPRETVQALAEAAHQVCPYSNATRGNIDVTVAVA